MYPDLQRSTLHDVLCVFIADKGHPLVDLFLPLPKNHSEDVQELKRRAAKEYYNYLYPHIVQKRANLADDIISDLIQAEDGDRLSDDEIVRTTMFIVGAGIETTTHLLANTFYSFLYDNNQIYGEIQANRELLPNAIEEMLRYRFNILLPGCSAGTAGSKYSDKQVHGFLPAH
ncbi:cytochrome P450 [Paenibacillus sp. JZ16]|uniref:cytochrome P450 n=1 Tax=Paenibacillus sp. JZ16 TaxID=1906272 RepID=UPI001F1E6503|nr:cytochrome P450 [Paenibacillus sp. JZ16]